VETARSGIFGLLNLLFFMKHSGEWSRNLFSKLSRKFDHAPNASDLDAGFTGAALTWPSLLDLLDRLSQVKAFSTIQRLGSTLKARCWLRLITCIFPPSMCPAPIR
jgi:hypothetical protein